MKKTHEKDCKHPKCKDHRHVGDECIHKDGTRHRIDGCKEHD
jgi:hypothetical protein